jgi:hypothetical protein
MKSFKGVETLFVEKIQRGEKIHTIRPDKTNLWVLGRKIHFQINPYQPTRICFKEEICVSTQKFIAIKKENDCSIWVDDVLLNEADKERLIVNDGLTKDHFMEWFFPKKEFVFGGKIIHWTNLKY